MIDQTKNMMIGLFVIAACAIITFIILFLHPSVGDEGKVLRVRFANIDKLNIGTRVTFAGRPVGEVVEITEVPSVISEREVKNGKVYAYELKMAVDSKVNVFNTDSVYARTSGLLGEKSVEISPGALKKGMELVNLNDQLIYAQESGSVEDVFKDFSNIACKVDQALDNLNCLLKDCKERDTIKNINTALDNTNLLLGRLNSKWSSFDCTCNHLNELCCNLNTLSRKVLNGEGSIGKLCCCDDFYLRTTSVVSKAETIMDDINHWGLLFHLDKGWQRLRARRLNLMLTLRTPQEFRNYFNDEVNQISTSLSRVSMVLDRSWNSPCGGCLVEDREFTKVYAELMRRVETLEEALKMYNQQLVDTEVKKTELCSDCR